MGFTSLQEDVLDRLAEAEHHPIWEQLRSAAQQKSHTEPVEPRVLLEHIDRISKEYGSAGLTSPPGAHSLSSVGLLLAIEKNLKKQAESSAEIIEIERELSRACIEYRRAGELHRGSISVVRTHVQGVLDSCDRLAARISRHSERMPEELEKARAWALDNLRQCTLVERALSSIENLWGQFEAHRLRILLGYRPRLAEVGRLQLAEEQERQVTRDYDGHARINAVAGTGKSVVLIHKAIRLFAAHSAPRVLIATPTDSLAEELRQAVFSLTGLEGTDGRLQVKSIPEILREWGRECGKTVQILDSDSAMISWEGFIDEADRNPNHPLRVGSSPDFLRELNTRLLKQARASVGVASWTDVKRKFWLDFSRALNYLRDEIDWIVSGFLPVQYDRYLGRQDGQPLPREGRELTFDADTRRVVLRILRGWQEWLRGRNEMDTGTAAGRLLEQLVRDSSAQARFEKIFAVDHLLIDEAQELGTCEWGVLLRAVRNIKGRNAVLAAGDLEQRGRVRRLVGAEIVRPDGQPGLSFKGRAVSLRQQYRMTQQIANAGKQLLVRFGGKSIELEEREEPQDGFGACRDGLLPVVLETHDQEREVADVLRALEKEQSVALISTRPLEDDLRLCERIAANAGRTPARLRRVGQNARRFTAAVGTIDAMAGREFDVVFVVNFTALPTTSVPLEEWWRDAAAAYSAMTRARELVVLCCPGRSPFLDALKDSPDCVQSLRTAMEFREYIKRLI